MTAVKSVCTKLGIRGDGEAVFITTHGLRATMISLLISAGNSDAAVDLRTGHRDHNSLQSYHYLRGINGETQLTAFFRGSGAVQGELLDQVLYQAGQRDKKKRRLDGEPTEDFACVLGGKIPERSDDFPLNATEELSSGAIAPTAITGDLNAYNCTINNKLYKGQYSARNSGSQLNAFAHVSPVRSCKMAYDCAGRICIQTGITRTSVRYRLCTIRYQYFYLVDKKSCHSNSDLILAV